MVPTACICSLSVNRMEALGTTGLMAWRQPLQSQSCQIKILFHGLLTIHVHNYNISILWHHNFCCNFSACCMLQAPVIVVDQPMYSLPKKLQWNFPVTHGEDKYVVFLGGMHVKLTVDKCLGNWLEGSGWTTVVTTNSGIASGGTADWLFPQNVSSWKHKACLSAHCSCIVHGPCIFALWRQGTGWWSCGLHSMEEKTLRWTSICLLVLELGLSVINFLKAIHSGNFEDYIQSIRQPIPWKFPIDHMNYACGLTIQLMDMDCLASNHSNVYDHWEICRT